MKQIKLLSTVTRLTLRVIFHTFFKLCEENDKHLLGRGTVMSSNPLLFLAVMPKVWANN